MSKTLLFIVNPKAGRTKSSGPLFEAVAKFCEAEYLVSVRMTTGPKDATRIAAEEGSKFDVVVCCGGDGTLNETVTGLISLSAPPPLGYIPAGSTNDFAASLGLPSAPVEAAERILAGEIHPLDIGNFCGTPFVYVASFGAFAKASYSAPQSIKNDLGHLAYILEGVKDLNTLRPYKAKITTDQEVFDDNFLFGAITNSTSVGGLIKLPQTLVSQDDGRLELVLIPCPKNAIELQMLIHSLITQSFNTQNTRIIFRHVTQISIEMPEALPWTLDGEYAAGSKKMEISVAPSSLPFLL